MSKYIITLVLLLVTSVSGAFASGFELGVGLEGFRERETITTPFYNGTGYKYDERVNNSYSNDSSVRGSVGGRLDVIDDFAANVELSTNPSTVTRLATNVIYRASDRLNVKAGPNVTHRVIGETDFSYKPGIGAQVGAEYNLDSKSYLNAEYSITHYSNHYSNTDITRDFRRDGILIGVGLRF